MHLATLRPDENVEDAADLGLDRPQRTSRHDRLRHHRPASEPRRVGPSHDAEGPAPAAAGVRQPDRDRRLLLDREPNFFTTRNITSILFSTVVIGLWRSGTTFVIITGGIDLSIGTGMALCAVMSGVSS